MLEKRADIEAILVEPSPDMFEMALINNKSSIQLINKKFNEALNELPVVDNILFCRSLYSFSGNLQDYDDIFKSISKKISSYGHLFILEPSNLYNVEEYKEQLDKKEFFRKKELDFHWPIMKQALHRFNQGIINKEFTLFDKPKLLNITNRFGFSPKIINSPMYVFRKTN